MNARGIAEARQSSASDPSVSAFVAASAGSGKTKLLTDRLLRLMLAGADPARIQCLTFTKAGAAEMALRLRAKLGSWVAMDDPALDEDLRKLDRAPDEGLRAQARALFARVLDLPGELRIGTIHAFCQSLLRRFPLEAEISPHFRLADDPDAAEALREARERTLADPQTPQGAVAAIATLARMEEFARLAQSLSGERERLDAAVRLGGGLAAAYRRALGAGGESEAEILAGAVSPLTPTLSQRERGQEGTHLPPPLPLGEGRGEGVRAAALVVAERGSDACASRARGMLDWLSAPDPARWDEWRGMFLRKDGAACAASGFVNKKLADAEPDLAAIFLAEAERIRAIDDRLRALRIGEASAALARLAAPVLRRYAERKDRDGLLDYGDLIARTGALLREPGAAWVLYKLDGGLDHLLLDEVQDTAPDQWAIAHALTAEFFAGRGANEAERTVFAVGDRKQSIFSFQGADAAAFDDSRAAMRERVEGGGRAWRDVAMDVSFRSAAPVLELVDAVFADPAAAQGVSDGPIAHVADRAGFAGRVELWPLAPAADADDPEPWAVPSRNATFSSAPQRLAERLAEWIAGRIGTTLESRGRPLAAGDFLVLPRRRGPFDRALLRALKQRGVAVAGLDRLALAEQPAVADLLTLCDVLLLPEDDLSLACVLKSPLGFCDEDGLMALASPPREGSLWAELRRRAHERTDWGAAAAMIAGLMARVDYAGPHALLSEALVVAGGRARLLERLGPEAGEPVDELLSAALAYQGSRAASLQGFVQHVREAAAEVKREAEGAGDAVRIMTVHGAKGLQAPVVILPDTTALPPDKDPVHWLADPLTGTPLPVWQPRAEMRCAAADQARRTARQSRIDEHNRLLYVALTRAEDRLVVCGWAGRKAVPDAAWHALARRGFERLGARAEPFGDWGEMLVHDCPQTAEPKRAPESAAEAAAALPDWAGAKPPAEPPLPAHLAPSRPENALLGEVPPAASPLSGRDSGARFLRGRLVHALLQHLPDLPRGERAEAARRWLARPAHAVPDGAGLAEEVLAILDHPALAPLFGPGSRAEAPLTGVIGRSVIGGLVDRLAVTESEVLVADYKTNREPPACVEAAPVLYLRQMAAYRAVLRAIHPGRAVRCALVWTRAARVDVLPDALLDPHAPGASA